MLLCLTLSIIRYVSRVNWNNPGKGVTPCPTPWCSSYRRIWILVAVYISYDDNSVYFDALLAHCIHIRLPTSQNCDTMKGVRQADDPFICCGTKPDKGFELEISDATGRRQGKASGQRNSEKSVGDGQRVRQKSSWQSIPDSRRDQSTRERVQSQWGKTSQDESAFLVALWKFRKGCTSAFVYRCTKECRVSQLNLLALELTQAHIVRLFFVLFSPIPLIVFLVAVKKCVILLSEPLDDHRPRLKWFKEVDVFGGGWLLSQTSSSYSITFIILFHRLNNNLKKNNPKTSMIAIGTRQRMDYSTRMVLALNNPRRVICH